jgi:large subunit ribosomal protein L10
MERHEKEARVEELSKQLKGKGVVLLSDFTGMDVLTATEIRRRFREASVEFRVVKNTLVKRAIEDAGLADLSESLKGPNAIVLSKDDPIAPAKILAEFEKKRSTPKIKSGWVESRVLTAAEIRRLAELPSRDVLLAQIAAGFQAPISGFAALLSEMLRRFVSTLDEVAKKRGAEPDGAAGA